MRKITIRLLTIIAACICVMVVAGTKVTTAQAKDADGDYVVVIDPGHGGYDGGAVSAITGDNENVVNWAIATALKAELQTYSGVKVYLTRGSAEYQSNTGRASTAKELNADLAISIHINTSEVSTANGVVCYGTVNNELREQVRTLCQSISAKISALGLNKFNGGYDARKSTYSKSVDYYTFIGDCVSAKIPALLIEHCFFSNENDAKFVNLPDNQQKLGMATATAVAEHFELKKRGVTPGTCVELTRSYSAIFMPTKDGTYTVSDSTILNVSEKGLITALKPGIAKVTCTAPDGTIETVKVVVPKVKPVQLVAGAIRSSFKSFAEAQKYDKEKLMVKVIYSDGMVTQLDGGYTLGTPVEGTSIDEGNGHIKTPVDVPVTYGELSCNLNLFHYTIMGTSTGSSINNYKVVGVNKDVLTIPASYEGISDSAVVEVDAGIVIPDPNPEPEETESSEENNKGRGFTFNMSNMWLYVICAVLVVIIVVCIITLLVMYRKIR